MKRLHNHKPFKWIYKRYFKPDYTGVSKNTWILTDSYNERNQLFKMSWIPIVRHEVITCRNSPDDASLKEYFEKREKKNKNDLDNAVPETKTNNISSKNSLREEKTSAMWKLMQEVKKKHKSGTFQGLFNIKDNYKRIYIG